ncbi:MAG: HD domain-containing protein [Candidatus Uhrbacteria bacterium]
MLDKNTLLKIKNLAIKIDHNLAFGGKSKGNKHLVRVVRVAKFLAKKTGADLTITEAGAFLHDTALPSGNDYEYSQNKKIVKKLLKTFNLPKNKLNEIAECVASHEGTVKAKSLEAKIVHDADVLDKLGILGIIRHTWKMTNQNKIDPQAVKEKDIKTIINHLAWRHKKLQTPLAKKMAEYLIIPISPAQAKKIVMQTASLAINGVITEKIAPTLFKHLNQKQQQKLKEQLSLGYLYKFK